MINSRDSFQIAMITKEFVVHVETLDGFLLGSEQVGGRFFISDRALACLERLSEADLAKLRHQIWTYNRSAAHLNITMDTIGTLGSYQMPPFELRALQAFQLIVSRMQTLGQLVALGPILSKLATITGSTTGPLNNEFSKELPFYIGYWKEKGWAEQAADAIKIKPAGLIELEKDEFRLTSNTQAFVAMWFDDSMGEAYMAISQAVKRAGYDAIRIDRHEHNNRIDDEIISQIRKSKFLIADFTCGRSGDGQFVARGGVYFEAGFAQGIGLPVIWSARRDCLGGLHFDTRQYPHILWNSPEELEKELLHKIEAKFGRGPLA